MSWASLKIREIQYSGKCSDINNSKILSEILDSYRNFNVLLIKDCEVAIGINIRFESGGDLKELKDFLLAKGYKKLIDVLEYSVVVLNEEDIKTFRKLEVKELFLS